MADDKFHFLIPPGNIKNIKYEKHGGGKSFPRSNYSEHGIKLRDETLLIKQSESEKKDARFVSDIFLQIESPSQTVIKDYRNNIENLGFDFINYKDKSNIGTARISKEKFEDLDKRLVNYIESPKNKGKSYFSAIEKLSIIPVESKVKLEVDTAVPSQLPIAFHLYSVFSKREKFAINQAIINELLKFSSDVSQANFANGTTSIACTMSLDMVPIIANQFTSIKEAKLDQTAFVENAIQTQDLPNELKIMTPRSNSEICIIDSGVNNSSGIFNNILSKSINHLPKDSVASHFVHGTFVASRCVFGDNIDACLGTNLLEPYCKIIDVQIFGVDVNGKRVDPKESFVMRKIEEVIKGLHNTVKVYNLSLGYNNSINDNEYSATAKLLDFLSKKYKVLFVIAAGNINSLLGKYPKQHFSNPLARINSPAESILSLTVGAICKHEDTNSLSKKGELSPFSKVGPGADLGLKPELVAHGGNLILKYDRSPRVSTYGISPDGKSLAVDVGTSFSAPLISQYAQRLFDNYPGSDPNLVKALLCHFSVVRDIPIGIVNLERHCTGFGEPNIESAISAGPHNAAFIYEGKLDQENYQLIGFHVPKSLAAENKNSKLRIRITLIYDPSVNADNNAEYSQSRITFSLEKLGVSGMKSVNFSGDDYSIPWSPIIRFEKSFSRNYLSGQWGVRLRLYTRGKLPTKYMQDYALVVEVIDEFGSTDVYNDIKQEYGKIYKKFKVAA